MSPFVCPAVSSLLRDRGRAARSELVRSARGGERALIAAVEHARADGLGDVRRRNGRRLRRDRRWCARRAGPCRRRAPRGRAARPPPEQARARRSSERRHPLEIPRAPAPRCAARSPRLASGVSRCSSRAAARRARAPAALGSPRARALQGRDRRPAAARRARRCDRAADR